MEIREILDDLPSELDTCANMVFELEEMRHLSRSEQVASPPTAADIDRLTTILEGNTATLSTPHQTALLRLSARIQPLRASLDFLKPRLASFGIRAEKVFP